MIYGYDLKHLYSTKLLLMGPYLMFIMPVIFLKVILLSLKSRFINERHTPKQNLSDPISTMPSYTWRHDYELGV